MCHSLDTRATSLRSVATSTRHVTNSTEIRKSGVLTEAESPAEPLGRSSAFTVTHFPFFSPYFTIRSSVAFAHLLDDGFAYFAHVAAFVPAREIVKEKQFLIFKSYRTDDIFVHNVRNKKLRQSFGVDHLFACFLHILREVRYRFSKHRTIFYSLEIGPSKPFVKVSILNSLLYPLLDGRIVHDLNKFSRHRAFGNIEQAVKVKTALFWRAFPYANVLPAFTVAHHLETAL